MADITNKNERKQKDPTLRTNNYLKLPIKVFMSLHKDKTDNLIYNTDGNTETRRMHQGW